MILEGHRNPDIRVCNQREEDSPPTSEGTVVGPSAAEKKQTSFLNGYVKLPIKLTLKESLDGGV
jgi:hypothetical protein